VKNTSVRDLVLCANKGDKQAFGELADRHSERARRVAMRMVGNYDTACEIVQEALLQAYLGLSTLREPAHFAAWLIGIVQNICRNHLRAQQRLHITPHWPDEAELLADETVDPVALLERQERRALVLDAIGALSPKNQVATWLYYIEAMSIEEVAQTLDVSTTAVKGRLFQARKQLQAELAPVFTPIFTPVFDTPQLSPHQAQMAVQKRKQTMVTISAIKIHKNSTTGKDILYLFDTVNHRYLCIWIGAYEGEQIRLQLAGTPTTRPLTYRYFADFLQAMAIQLQSVQVARLHETTFFAVTQFRNGDLVKELDARPSDAIGLALHTGAPIFVDDELMAQNGKALAPEEDIDNWFASEIERIQKDQRTVASWQAELFQEDEARFTQWARGTLQNAIALAQSFRHNYVGTEHLLWSMAQNSSDIAAQLLHNAGVTEMTVNQAAMVRFGPPPKIEQEDEASSAPMPQLVPRVGQVLALANEAREQSNAQYIGTEHLLLGILREGGGMAVTLLEDLAVDQAGLEEQLLAAMADAPA